MSDDGAEAADEDLVRRARAGDATATRILVERYAPLLRTRARRRIVGPLRRKLGESDLVQETYAAAMLGLDEFEDRGPGSFRAWIEKILQHKANDQVKRHLRSQKRDVRREVSQVLSRGEDAEPVGRGSSPSAAVLRDETQEDVRRALDALTGDDRVILHIVHEQGKSFEEAGRLMDRSTDAARALYGRALHRLSKRLRKPE